MNIDSLRISSPTKRKDYSADAIITILDGGGGGGNRAAARTTMTASYRTDSISPTVYVTALKVDGTTLVARTTSGIALTACGDYTTSVDITGLTGAGREFVAVWDEGDVNDYVLERIVVDT